MPDFMTGALVLSILAWPTSAEVVPFRRISQELMAEVLRQTKRSNPGAIDNQRRLWPQCDWNALLARADKRRMASGSLQKRLKQRMVAAKMAIGLTHDELFGQPARLPPSLTGLSIDQLANLVGRETAIDDAENVEKLVWRKSLPIIHLATSIQLILTGQGGDQRSVPCDTQDIDFFRRAVLLACRLEPMVLAHPAINITADKLTRVRWFE